MIPVTCVIRAIINEILEGNLLNPTRLEDVMKKTKFIKRILNFFMPSKQNFINLEWVTKEFLMFLERRKPVICQSWI